MKTDWIERDVDIFIVKYYDSFWQKDIPYMQEVWYQMSMRKWSDGKKIITHIYTNLAYYMIFETILLPFS